MIVGANGEQTTSGSEHPPSSIGQVSKNIADNNF